MRAIPMDARLIVDQHQIQAVKRSARVGIGECRSHHPFHHVAVPATVGRPSLLERMIGIAQVLLIDGRHLGVASASAEQAPDEE